MSRHDISDEKWAIINPLLRQKKKDPRGRKPKDDRLMLNGVLWILKTGAPWRDLPPEFGPYQTVHRRFLQWARAGTWDEVLLELAKDADPEAIMIDGTFVKLHQHGTGAKGGTSGNKSDEVKED
jgi:transposase